jgi:hypothetical protein
MADLKQSAELVNLYRVEVNDELKDEYQPNWTDKML